jgi:hypothetical protein
LNGVQRQFQLNPAGLVTTERDGYFGLVTTERDGYFGLVTVERDGCVAISLRRDEPFTPNAVP